MIQTILLFHASCDFWHDRGWQTTIILSRELLIIVRDKIFFLHMHLCYLFLWQKVFMHQQQFARLWDLFGFIALPLILKQNFHF